MLRLGKPAPAFTLPNQHGRPTSLADFRGRFVVLYFYPADDTPGCTIEACEFSDALKAFEALDAKVFGCSPDDPASHQRFIAKRRLTIDLLSDVAKTTMADYGAWAEKEVYGRRTFGVVRSTALIDPEGNLAAVWPRVNVKGHAAEVAARIESLRRAARAAATASVAAPAAPAEASASAASLPTPPAATLVPPKPASYVAAATPAASLSKAAAPGSSVPTPTPANVVSAPAIVPDEASPAAAVMKKPRAPSRSTKTPKAERGETASKRSAPKPASRAATGARNSTAKKATVPGKKRASAKRPAKQKRAARPSRAPARPKGATKPTTAKAKSKRAVAPRASRRPRRGV